MQVIFRYVKFKNIMSYGNYDTVIPLDQSRHTIITAKNGGGKSTIIDAICYALYGKPYRKIKLGQLINSINKKALLVTIAFTIGTNEYTVTRGQKPSLFEIHKNGELVPEDAATGDYQRHLEHDILGINFKTFKQIIVIGSDEYVPFMSLEAKDRRNITEEVLDISLFSNMLDIVKEKIRTTKSSVDSIAYEIELNKNTLVTQKQLHDKLAQEAADKSEQTDARRKLTEQKIAELKTKLDTVSKQIDALFEVNSKHTLINNAIQKIHIQLNRSESDHARCSELISFFHQDQCPTCKQAIDETVKQQEIAKHTESISKLNTDKQTLLNIQKEFQVKMTAVTEQLALLNQLITEKNNIVYYIQAETAALSQMNTEAESQSLELCKATIKKLVQTVVDKTAEKNTLTQDLAYYVASQDILKDNGIKSKIIAQFIPILNTMINEYLEQYGMFVLFELDETFNETIKSRNRDTFSYNSFSMGERLKIDLAILFSWRKIAAARNSVSTNLIFFDETMDSSMDEESVDTFMNILETIDEGMGSIVVSHRNMVPELFDRHITIKKTSDFSMLTIT